MISVFNKICSPFIIYRFPMFLFTNWAMIVPTNWKWFCLRVVQAVHKTSHIYNTRYVFNIMKATGFYFFHITTCKETFFFVLANPPNRQDTYKQHAFLGWGEAQYILENFLQCMEFCLNHVSDTSA